MLVEKKNKIVYFVVKLKFDYACIYLDIHACVRAHTHIHTYMVRVTQFVGRMGSV